MFNRRTETPHPAVQDANHYVYHMYGLTLHAPFEIPELVRSFDTTNAPDITVALDDIQIPSRPDSKLGQWFSKCGTDCYLDYPTVGKFLISNGKSIFISPKSLAPISDVRSVLLGLAMATVLYQRSLLPLHVSGVVVDNGAWAFSGPSGAGKSTLSAWLTQKFSFPTFSDDIACLDYICDQPTLVAGSNRVKLWKDALDQLSMEATELIRDMARFNKFHIIPASPRYQTPLPLHKLIFLSRSKNGNTTVTQRKGAKAVAYAASAAYQPAIGVHILGDQEMFRHAARLARSCAIYDFKRPWGYQEFDKVVELLFEKCPATQG